MNQSKSVGVACSLRYRTSGTRMERGANRLRQHPGTERLHATLAVPFLSKTEPASGASVFHATEYAQQRCKNALRLALDPTVLFCALAQKTQVLGGPSNQGELGNLGISQNTLSEI